MQNSVTPWTDFKLQVTYRNMKSNLKIPLKKEIALIYAYAYIYICTHAHRITVQVFTVTLVN